MALPNESKLEQESKELGGVDINPSVRSDNFVFQPSDSWLDTPMTEEFTKGLNPDYVSQIDRYSAVINPYAPSSLANFNTPVPGQSVGQYNPVAQQTPPDMSTPEGAIRSLELAANKSYTKEQLADVKPVIADPIYSSSKATQFDRYYNHPKFAELGFHPYAKNEEYYNANSSIYEDMSRMFGQMGQLTGSGFISTYRSIGDLFDSNDNYLSQPDLETATEFEDAMAIGMSTREGFGGFANNMLLNTGYTLGIIGSIAVEELALAGLTYASGGFAGTAAAAGTAANLKRLGQVISNSFQLPKLAKATRNMLKGLDKVDNSRTFWQATKSGDWGVMGSLFAPETMAAVKNFNSGKNAAQNLTNFAKAQNAFGGFYRDLRSVNYALAESKLEGGLTFNQQIKNGMAIEQAKDPLNPNITPEQMADIREKAERASFSTIMMNAPFIYLSNKLVLDNALGGFNKSLGRLMNDKITGIGRKLVQTKKTLGADGKIAQNVFEYAGDGLKGFTKTLKAAGVKGSLKMGLGASARYFAANLAEGIQEVGQEAISYGTKQYYSNLQNDPLLGGIDISNAAISSAVDSQFSGQGFETFMSGFLTGGLVAGPQKLIFQAMPNLYTRLATPEKFQEYKAQKEAFYDSVVETHNKAWNEMAADPNAIFDPNRLNFLVQKEVAAEMKKSAYESDMFGFTDAKDFGKFQQMYTIMQNGTSNLFRSQLNDFLNLTDEELIQAFPVSKQEVKSGKLRARVQDMLIQIDKTEDAYNKNKDRFENPFDASQFKKGTREYNEEALKQVAYDHASYLYMFTEDGFNRALERSDDIYNELASDPILAEIAANDITVLLDQDSIDNEVKILLTEIAVLEDTKENKKLKKQKLDKLTRLQNINSILTDKTNLTNKGVFDQRKVGKLTKAFESYVQHLADTKNSFVDRGRIQEVLKKIVDYKTLKGRAKVYDKAIQYLSDPNKFNEVFKRQSEINKEIFKKNRTDIRKRVEKYVSKNEANQLLNDLFTLDVYPDAEQAERFLQTGNSDFLKSFYNENGIIDPTFDKELYAQIQDMLDKYKDLTKIDTVEETEQQKEEVVEVKKSTDKIDKVLDDAEVDAPASPTFGSDESVNPVIKTLLDKLYKTYRRDQLALGKKALGQKEWLNSKQAQLANKGYEAIKQLWYQSIKEDFKSPSELNKAYETDNGFIEWLKGQETNPDVRDILQEANLSFSDFYKVESTEDITDDIDVEYSGKVIASGPAYVVLEQTTIGDDGAVNKFYQIKTKDNKDISEDILKVADISEGAVFSNIDKAIKKQKELEELIPSDSTFEFDGVELYNGAEVIDGDGNKFVVTSSKNSLNKYKNLSIISSDKINLKGEERKQATIILKPGQFKNSYKIEELNFNRLPNNVSRLRIDEPVRPFAHQNGRGTANQETREQASKRYDAVMETLTPEERATIQFIVMVNPAAGNIIEEELKYEDKESNPFIKRVSDSYIIGIRIGDAGVQAKVNAALKAKDINPTDSADGIFAYMPNNGVKIFNNKKEEIDPRDIDQETANNTFFRSSKSATNPLQSIRNNFAVQASFIQFIENKLGDKDSVTIPLYELAEEAFTFSLTSRFNLKTPSKSLTDLAYNTVDGSYIIYDNRNFTRKDENGKIIVTRRSDTKTNIEDIDEETKIIAQVKQDLENRGMYDLARNMGAYVAIIKSPNGEYTLAELKATSMQDLEINDFVKSLVDRAVETREENLDDPTLPSKANRKNLGYNVDFNADLSQKVFISTQPGYSIDISVDPGGRIEFNIYDKQTRQKLLVHTSGKLKGKPNPIVINQTDIESVNASENYLKALDDVITQFNKTDIAKKLGIKLERSSFRKSFSEGVKAQEIVDGTTTTLDDRVRFDYKLNLQQDSSYIQASRNVPSSAEEVSKKTEQEKDDTQTLEEKLAEMSAADEATPTSELGPLTEEEVIAVSTPRKIFKDRLDRINEFLQGKRKATATVNGNGSYTAVIYTDKFSEVDGLGRDMRDGAQVLLTQEEANRMLLIKAQKKIKKITLKEAEAAEQEVLRDAYTRALEQYEIVDDAPILDIQESVEAFNKSKATTDTPQQTSEVTESPEVNFEVEKQNLKDAIDARKKEIIANTERKDLKNTLKNDKTLNDLKNKLRGLQANKIISPNLSITDVEDINVFKSWAASALPDFISIDDITTLGNNMKAGGVRVGAFVLDVNDLAENIKVKGTIYTGASSPYRYHEAFHGVFRMLLTDAEIEKYLGLARREVREKLRKEGKDFKTELQKFRNSADTYTNMSEKRLIEEYYEEYLADQFEIFKKSPKQSTTSSENKSLFTRVIEWIKAVLGNFTRNELTDLYENIDAGKYKSASTVINRFTDAVVQGITIEANVLIPTEEFEVNDKKEFTYLDPDAANAMIRSMAAIYISREEKNTNTSITRNDLLTEVIKDFKQLYDITSDANINLSVDQIDAMLEYDSAFENYEKEIINSVSKFLSLVDISLEDPIYVAELKEDSEGLRNVDDWDKDASLIGGFSSLSAKLRRYIMTTSVEERDIFDHEELTPGEKLIVPVDFNEAYNGMLKAVKNTTDANKILQQIYLFGQNNPQTNAVATRIFNDLGITEEDIANNTLENGVKNPLFFNALIKGLENFRVDYLFIHRNVDGRIVTYSAAQRDDANSQIDRWGQAYSTIFKYKLKMNPAFKKEALSFLDTFQRGLNKTPKKMSDESLSKRSKEAADKFREYLGINISRQYIAYHLVQGIQDLTPNQKLLKDVHQGVKLITEENVSNLKTAVENNVYIFSTKDAGMQGILKQISIANAPFDETVGASVFKNAEGNLVYAHQKPTFHLKRIAALNDPAKLEELKQNDEYLNDNLLLNSSAFIELSRERRLSVTRISGGKKGNINITDEGLEESRGEGKDYGDFTAKDFITTLLNSYTDSFNSSTGKLDATVSIEDADGNIIEEALSPVLIRVIEASNTGDMTKLPVIKAVKLGSKGSIELTDEALDGYLNNIKAEFERIKRESNEETKTSRKIVDYNDGAMRALKFNQNASLLSPGKLIDTYTKSVKFVTSDAQLSRVREGNQKALFYNKDVATKIIKFTDTNEVRQALIQEKGKPGNKAILPVKNLGLVTVTNLNREEIFTLLGEAVSNEKTKIAKYPVKIGEATFYTESNDLRKFLKGQIPMYIYTLDNEVVDTTDTLEQPTEETAEVTQEPVIKSTDSRNWKEDIEQAIANDPTLSFDEVIDSLGGMKIFEEFLKNRLELEFQNFNKKLNSISTDADLSNYIRFGLTNKFGDNTGVVAKSNNQLNLIDNKEYNLRQIFFSNNLNTIAINQILLGDTAISLKDAVDAVKRAKMQNAAYDSAASIISAPEYAIEHPLQQMNLFALTEPKAAATFNEGEIDYADAQLWMTTKAFRYMWFGFGKLSASQAELLNKVDAGEDISYEELLGNADKSNESYAKINAMLNSKKLVYGDGQTFVKMSAFTLTKQYTSRQDENGNWVAKENKVELHNLRERMEKFEAEQWSKGIGTIAMAAPVSALKMMKENVQDINEALSTDVAFTEDQSMQLDANFMGLQTITPSNKLIVTDATQIKTIVTSEQKDDTEVIIDGEPTTIGAIRKSYNGAIKQRVSLKYINRRNLLFDFDIEYAMDLLKESVKEGDIKPDLYVYLNYAQAGLEASNATSNILEMFSLDENGEQKYNLNNPQTVKKFEQLFLSFFSKGVLSEKTTGMSMTLVSDLGVRVYRRVLSVDENGMPDRQEVIREDVWDRMSDKPEILFNIDDGASKAADSNLSGLEAAVEEAGSEGVVILDRLRSNLKDYDSKGEWTRQRYSEMIIPPHHTEVGDLIADTNAAIPEAVAKMFGVRIPSQDNHSAVNLKAVDFMPGFYGSSAVFARELIEISGADFDIDKLYIQSKDFYVKDGEFIEYGKANTAEGLYVDYIQAVNKNVNTAGSSLNQALLKQKNSGSSRGLSLAEESTASDDGFNENAIKALSVTGLPISFEEYLEYKEQYNNEPYSEAINNKIVDYKFALIGNEHVTNTPGREVAISHEPADTKVLENLLEDLAEDIPYFQNVLDNEEMDVDNLLGQVLSFAANKEGAKSIGSVVLPNLYLNLLQEYKAKVGSEKLGAQKTTINLKLNDLNYNDFGITESSDGNRTQYVLSALITAMTDNAKLRLSSKLGLNKDALAVVANMTALGVPIKTSILLINHPTIKELYFKAINKEQPMDPGIGKLVKDRIELLEEAFGDLESVSVMDPLLSSEIDDNLLGIDKDNIAKKIKDNEFTREKAIKEYSILKQFQIAHDIKDYTSKLGAVFSLTNGLGKDVSAINKTSADVNDLGLNLNNAEYKKYTEERINKGLPVIDVRDLFKDTWQGEYLKIFKEIKDKILPNVMLTQTQTFQDLYDQVILNMNDYSLDEKTLEKIRIDLLSYLTIKAYDQKLLTEDSKYAGSLSNGIIYPQLEGEKITEVVERLRKSNPNNFFLDSFVVLEGSNDEGNTTGLNLANANTFNNLSDSNKVNLQSSFAKLYGELETRADATKIIHYIMVKDGFSYGYQSLLDALTPFTFETFLSQIDTAEVALRGRSEDALFKQTFGFNYDEMVDDFIKGYLKNTNNKLNLKNNWSIGAYNPVVTNIDVQVSLYKNHIVSINTDTLYIFGDNEAENGKDGNRSIRDLGNTARIVYKKNLADTKSNYYTETDYDNFIQTYEESLDALENLISEYDKVVFPKYLIPQSEIKNVKENSPAIFEYLQESLKNRFGYDLLGGKKVSKKISKNIEKTEVFIDESGDKARLKINTYPGQKITDTADVMDLRKPNVNKQKKNTYTNLKKKGFTPENIQIKGTTYLEVPVPLVRRINVGTTEAPRYRYFVLDKYQSVVPKKMTASQLPTANYAEYIEFEPQGSRSQWAAGFMFAGNVPTSKEIRNFVKNSTDQDFDPEMNLDYDFDMMDNTLPSEAITAGASVEYDGESIKIDGKNPDNITEKDVEQIANDNNAEFIEREITDEDVDADNEALSSLIDQLGTPKENNYPTLTEFWDSNIQLNKENKAKLADNNINDLDDFIKAYESGIYENEETFIDQIKKCNL